MKKINKNVHSFSNKPFAILLLLGVMAIGLDFSLGARASSTVEASVTAVQPAPTVERSPSGASAPQYSSDWSVESLDKENSTPIPRRDGFEGISESRFN